MDVYELQWEPIENEVAGRCLGLKAPSDWYTSSAGEARPWLEEESELSDPAVLEGRRSWNAVRAARNLFNMVQRIIDGHADAREANPLSDDVVDLESLRELTMDGPIVLERARSVMPEQFTDWTHLKRLIDTYLALAGIAHGAAAIETAHVALLTGTKPVTVRGMLANKSHPLKRAPERGEKGEVFVTRESFMGWIRTARPRLWATFKGRSTEDHREVEHSDQVITDLIEKFGYTYHPNCNPSTITMAALVSPEGQVIAIEKTAPSRNVVKPKLWFPCIDEDHLRTLGSIAQFSRARPVVRKGYERHSGLTTYPELGPEALGHVTPKWTADVREVVQFQQQIAKEIAREGV